MSDNPNIQRVGTSLFNLLMVDDWLVCLFRTNNSVWNFLEYLGEKLEAGLPVPKEIHVFTITTKNAETPEIVVLETGKIALLPMKVRGQDELKELFIYTAIHDDHETKRLTEIVQSSFSQIMEALFS